MNILELWPQIDGMVRYLLRDEDKALKKAFNFLESEGW